ncbi:MAG: methyltransferase domain-containing protein [Planctomycetaceae bacterium]|nr:methyltransferase domain-containing protein [Planctomycetaceae bacterium]
MPAEPDAFLDDPAVLEANRADDYMPYWGFLWPAAPPMVGAVLAAEWPASATVLEIGCGIGLVGLAALRRGLRVTLSDYDQTSVDLARHNARQNGYEADGLVLDWRRPTEQRFDVILGSDVTYEVRNHGPILDVIGTMLNPGGVAWIGDAGRQISAGFLPMAQERGFEVGLFDASGRTLPRLNVGEFQLFVLRR